MKGIMWQITEQGQDNIKHTELVDEVDFVSIPCKENSHPESHDECVSKLEVVKSSLAFKGNIKLSASGKSYNIFRHELDMEDDLVELVPSVASDKTPF